jgi:putative SOS response-associated peptidase YedK
MCGRYVLAETSDSRDSLTRRFGVLIRELGVFTYNAADARRLAELLKPYPADEMTAYRVSNRVNDVKNDGPELIEAQG